MTAPVPIYRGSALTSTGDLLVGDRVLATDWLTDQTLTGTVLAIRPAEAPEEGHYLTLRHLIAAPEDADPDVPSEVVDTEISPDWAVALRERLRPQPDQYLPGTLWRDEPVGIIYAQTITRLTAESGVPYTRISSPTGDDGPLIGTTELQDLLTRLVFMSTTA